MAGMILGRYKSTPPTVADGAASELACDATGQLLVSVTGAAASTVAVSSIATGNNNIGNVDVESLPALPSGSNEIGIVQASGFRTNTATTNAATAQDTSADVVLAANASRRGFIIANAKQTIIKLSFGGTPTATAYHVALKACTADDDGTGGVWIDDKWTGAVSAISSGAAGGIVVTEFS